MIHESVLKMKRRTVLVIQQVDADALGLLRNTTAGEVQDAVAELDALLDAQDEMLAKEDLATMENTEDLTEF